MFIILERDKFTKLFKFGEIKVGANRLIDGFQADTIAEKIDKKALDAKLPIFEQDHEIIILEVFKEKIKIEMEISVKMSFVKRIFPLTKDGQSFLRGKINPNIIIQDPLLEKLVNEIKVERDLRIRRRAKDALYKLFRIDKSLALQYANEIEEGIMFRLYQNNKPAANKYLFNLITFNRNPVYPAGNVEYYFKAGSVFVEMKGGVEKDFESGPFYQFLQHNLRNLSGASLSECLTLVFKSKESENVKSELKKQYPELNAFAVGAWFLYFKDKLNQNEYDLDVVVEEINSLKASNFKEIAVVLHMIGMLFSFDNLYESIYKMKKIPVFDQSPKPGLTEQNDKLLGKLRAKEDEIEQLKKDNAEMKETSTGKHDKQTTALVKIEEQVLKPELKNDLVKEEEITYEKPEDDLEHKKVKESAKDSDQSKNKEKPASASRSRKTQTDGPSNKTTSKPSKKKESKKNIKNLELSFPNDFPIENKRHYSATELRKIVSLIKKSKLLKGKKELETVCDAILNYAHKGCNYDHLHNEIEELKKNLGFSDDEAKKLINIILEVE